MGSPLVIPYAPAAAVIGGGFIGPVHVEALRRILPRLEEQGHSFGFPVR